MTRIALVGALLLGLVLGIVGMFVLALSPKQTLELVIMLCCAAATSVLGVERWLGEA